MSVNGVTTKAAPHRYVMVPGFTVCSIHPELTATAASICHVYGGTNCTFVFSTNAVANVVDLTSIYLMLFAGIYAVCYLVYSHKM